MITLVFALSMNLFALDRVIYGEDDRIESISAQNPLYATLARSTAAKIAKNQIYEKDDQYYEANIIPLSAPSASNICKEERFFYQPTLAKCSGFLISKDLLVTAGHCMQLTSDCQSYVWVFDYNLSSVNISKVFINEKVRLKKENIYHCAEIIKQVNDRVNQDDFAIIRLDRPVIEREPLTIRTEGKIADGEKVMVIGHPSGLPTKIADNAFVRKNDHPIFFVTNLDSFHINSGSAVFNAETGVVEGILVRGENDYIFDHVRQCKVPKKCAMDECRGEEVTRITNLIEFL